MKKIVLVCLLALSFCSFSLPSFSVQAANPASALGQQTDRQNILE
jgi:hypothetical protein